MKKELGRNIQKDRKKKKKIAEKQSVAYMYYLEFAFRFLRLLIICCSRSSPAFYCARFIGRRRGREIFRLLKLLLFSGLTASLVRNELVAVVCIFLEGRNGNPALCNCCLLIVLVGHRFRIDITAGESEPSAALGVYFMLLLLLDNETNLPKSDKGKWQTNIV